LPPEGRGGFISAGGLSPDKFFQGAALPSVQE
jgi:hypothetical protein